MSGQDGVEIKVPRWIPVAHLVAVPALVGLALFSPGQHWRLSVLLALSTFAVVSDLTGVETATSKLKVSGSFLALVLAMVLLGGGAAAVVGLLTIAVGWWRWREEAHYLRNNLVTYAAFPLVTGTLFQLVAHATRTQPHQATWYLLVFAAFVVALALNFVLVAGYQCLFDQTSLAVRTRETLRPLMASELASALLAVGTAFIYEQFGLVGLAFTGLTLVIHQYLVGQLLLSHERGQELERRAVTDDLTGLANRAFFFQHCDEAIADASSGGRSLAVMIMDLNRFKEINDTLGHHYGDRVLRAIAERISHGIPDEVDFVARLGGDEFAFLVADEHGAPALAWRLIAALREPFRVEEMDLEIDASVGIARFPDDGTTTATLLQHADVAMYAAKDAQSVVELYAPARDRHTAKRLSLVGDLRRAISSEAGDELFLEYQPKVDLDTRRLAGVEALVRWNHPELGRLPPVEFIELAEQTGLIRPLTEYVLDLAMHQARAWRDAGLELCVAVNLSPRSLGDRKFADRIKRQLAATGLASGALMLEITESTLMNDPAGAMETIRALHTMGIELSIDDFGTGYSSLAHIKRLPIAELKVDRSFVSSMLTSPNDAVIVRSTIDLAHNLGLRTVAEGVEDAETLERLAELGCDCAQGYYLARPLAPHALLDWAGVRPAVAA
jgi:diguanylate cyclase (GGDEF)-like protein